jgi:hypothetical protein
MNIHRISQMLAALALAAVLVPAALAEPPVDKGKGANAAQQGGQSDEKGKGYTENDDTRGQQVSECNHRANERNMQGKDRQEFVEWCTEHGAAHKYDERRFAQDRPCYRKADEKGLSGDLRRVYVQDCLRRQEKAR